MSKVPKASVRNRLLFLLVLAALGAALFAVGLLSSRGAPPETAPELDAELASGEICVEATVPWLLDLEYGYVTSSDVAFFFGSESAHYQIVMDAYYHFRDRVYYVGQGTAEAEAIQEVIRPRCREFASSQLQG